MSKFADVGPHKRNVKGRLVNVRPHKRKYNPKRGDYRVEKKRILPPKNESLVYDQIIQAKPPGKRISKNGKIYYERRFNRSDEGSWL
jgi:hypothetical protein